MSANSTARTPGPWEYLQFDSRVVHQRCDHGAMEIAWSDADYRLISAAPQLLEALKEMREACTAAMRVIADIDAMKQLGAEAETRQQRFVDELKTVGVKNGFGVRAEAAIAKAEGR